MPKCWSLNLYLSELWLIDGFVLNHYRLKVALL